MLECTAAEHYSYSIILTMRFEKGTEIMSETNQRTEGSELQLGIKTIGNLLIEGKVKIEPSKEGNEEGIVDELAIPDYQRPYKWTVKNVLRLFSDIEEARRAEKTKYRVGTLILHKENGVYNIVDGQQRLITFSLLLRCLSESIRKKEKSKLLDEKLDDNPYNRNNIPKNYLALDRSVKKLKEDERSALYDYVRDKCEMPVIITEDLAQAFQFFDSQNARGKKLYPHDLLKAYHLREMEQRGNSEEEEKQEVEKWEENDQEKLAELFDKRLYRIKKWIMGDQAYVLTEKDIGIFKGITGNNSYPYAQYHKSACRSESGTPAESSAGKEEEKNDPTKFQFQIDAPVIAGKHFFEYARHYYDLLKDIRDNRTKLGRFINGEEIVKTLDLRYKSSQYELPRFLFDEAVLLYVDRFCHTKTTEEEAPSKPTEEEDLSLKLFKRFVEYAFVWAYSFRAMNKRCVDKSLQNYVLNGNHAECKNAFNMYKEIAVSESPKVLFQRLAEKLVPLVWEEVRENVLAQDNDLKEKGWSALDKKHEKPEDLYGEGPEKDIPEYYLYWFKELGYLKEPKTTDKEQSAKKEGE